MIDLFGLEQQPKRIHDKPEAAALLEVLKALNTHPAVAWCQRMNSAHAPPSLPNDLGDLKKMEYGQTHYKPNARAGHSQNKQATYAGCHIRLAMD